MATAQTPPAQTPNSLIQIIALKEGLQLGQLAQVFGQYQQQIDQAVQAIGTVHFLRFVVLDSSSPNLLPMANSVGPFKLAVLANYDGTFDAYVQDFVTHLSFIFDALLPLAEGGEHLVPIKDHVQELIDFERVNDGAQQPPNSQLPLFMGYNYTVQQILAGMS
jgi:hypothetical protein